MVNSIEHISLSDWLTFIALLLAAIGLYLNVWQQIKSNKQKRAAHVSDVLWKIYDDDELSNIYYKIEYHDFEYDDEFHGSETEKKLDKLISTFDILAKQYYLGLITLKDIEVVSYEYLVIYQNTEVQEYFKGLDNWFDLRGIKCAPFGKFRDLGKLVVAEHFHG